jgi:hypothetical protein
MKRRVLGMALVVFASATMARADWTAYNDCIGVSDTATMTDNTAANASKYYRGQSGLLKDFATGTSVSASVTVNTTGNTQGPGGGAPSAFAAGTDAASIFSGKVDLTNGVIYYGDSGWTVDLVFTGLNSTSQYALATTFDRGRSDYTDRWSVVSIQDADAYTYASSAGTWKVSDSAVSIQSYNTANGYVAKWTGIKAGADGDFTIRFTQAANTPGVQIPVGATQNDRLGYGPGAFMLQEIGGIERVNIAQNHFKEVAAGATDWTPGTGNTELGFKTSNATQQGAGETKTIGAYSSSSSPDRYRVRGYMADLTFDPVDVTEFKDVKVSFDVLRRDNFEGEDYLRAIATNGTDSIDLVRLEAEAIQNTLTTADQWYTFSADIPDSWDTVVLKISASDNASGSAEILDFDNIRFVGTQVPEPGTLAMLAGVAVVGLFLARRRCK